MHSALVWASCNNREELEAIAGLVVLPVPPQQLPEFFWAHLEKDFELLGRDTGRGLDETVMIVHLVLRQILLTNPPTGTYYNVIMHNALLIGQLNLPPDCFAFII